MSNTFNTGRFFRILCYDLRRAWRRYGLTLILLCFVPVVISLLSIFFGLVTGCGWQIPGGYARLPVFCICGIVLCYSFPAIAFGGITDKSAGSGYILMPASTVEKFISMLVISVIIAPVLFLAGYLIVDSFTLAIHISEGKFIMSYFREYMCLLGLDEVPDIGSDSFSFGRLSLVSGVAFLLFSLAGALWFRRRKVLLTILVNIALFTVVLMLLIFYIMRFVEGLDYVELWQESEQVTQFVRGINTTALIADIIGIFLMCFLSWYRIKTIEH